MPVAGMNGWGVAATLHHSTLSLISVAMCPVLGNHLDSASLFWLLSFVSMYTNNNYFRTEKYILRLIGEYFLVGAVVVTLLQLNKYGAHVYELLLV